jgi:class 3 adenylate cyclase/tetratricopeptide (TPR) repeat protein
VAGPAEPRHERRLLTVLFADLAGFTAASDGADPEDVRARVRPFHALVRREAARTGGTVARVVGDGVMVVWGYPVAREDDAVRALRSALAIRDGVRRLPGALHVRIGLNTGEAVVAFGSGDERADDAMGDAVNVAARLAAAAPVDGIVAGHATLLLAGDLADAGPLEPLLLKGKADPVAASLVHSLEDQRPGRTTAFVGRTAELAALRAAWHRVAEGGRPVRMLVTGEPGIGKSRLVAELRRVIPAEAGASWHTGRCRPEEVSPGWALGGIVKAWAGITDDATPEGAMDSLRNRIPGDIADRDWLLDRLGPLIGADTGAGPAGPGEVVAAWTRLIALLAADGPAVVELEDVHWADPELLRFLTDPLPVSVAAPVLVLATARPEALVMHPGLGAIQTVSLAPLPADQAERLVDLVADGLPERTRSMIAARGGGNPLFTGELVRLAGQLGPAQADRALLPTTVQAVIAARLDLLDPNTRAVARDAAVIGDRFWRGSAEALAGLRCAPASSVDPALAELVRLELVRPTRATTLPGDVEYAFRHALVRDVAYGQLTRGDRWPRHAEVAQWLARTAGEERRDLAGVVADQDLAAIELATACGVSPEDLDPIRRHAFDHLLRAGAHAEEIDTATAVARYSTALDVATTPAARLAAEFALAKAQHDSGADADAMRTIETAIDLARSLGDIEIEARALLIRSRARWQMRDKDGGRADTQLAIRLLEPRGPSSALVDAYCMASSDIIFGVGRRPSAGLGMVERALDTAAALGFPPPAPALRNRGLVYASVNAEQGFADLQEAARLALASGRTSDYLGVLELTAVALLIECRFDPAEATLAEMARIARERGAHRSSVAAMMHLALVRLASGDLRGILAAVEDGRRDLAMLQGAFGHDMLAIVEVQALDMLGDHEAAASTARAHAARLGWTPDQFNATPLVLEAAARGSLDDARHVFAHVQVQPDVGPIDFDLESALEYLPIARAVLPIGGAHLVERMLPAGDWGVPPGRAIAQALEGLLAVARGDPGAAVPLLRTAFEAFDRIDMRPEAAHAAEALANALAPGGEDDEATDWLREALHRWDGMDAPLQVARLRRRLGA